MYSDGTELCYLPFNKSNKGHCLAIGVRESPDGTKYQRIELDDVGVNKQTMSVPPTALVLWNNDSHKRKDTKMTIKLNVPGAKATGKKEPAESKIPLNHISIKEAHALTGKWLDVNIRKGEIKGVRVGRAWYVAKEDVEALMAPKAAVEVKAEVPAKVEPKAEDFKPAPKPEKKSKKSKK